MVSVNLNSSSWRHILWLFAAVLLVFGLPFIILRILKIPIDFFYLVFLASGITFMTIYLKRTSLRIRPALKSGWALGSIFAIFIGVGLLSYTLSIKSGLYQPELNTNILVILWRGILFGMISAAMISVFPFVAVWRSFAGNNPGNLRKIWVSLLAVLAIFLTSLSYSAGVSGFRNKQIIYEAKVSVLTGLPTLLSGNPLASPIAGALLHTGTSMTTDYGPDSSSGVRLAIKKDTGEK